MIINLEKAKKEFMKYVEKFDKEEYQIQRKINHSIRVMEISRTIAQDLKLEKDEVQLATLIGLLHDIGRFEQYTKYKTFIDYNSVNHGKLGVEILETNNYLRHYIKDNKYDEIIKKAIINHNKYTIEDDLTPEEELFCKIIRDADKIDILYQVANFFWKADKGDIEKETITKTDIEPIINKKLINKENNRKTKSPKLSRALGTIAFVFDINFVISLRIIKEKDYINTYINRFNYGNKQTKDLMEEVKKIVNQYIESKIETKG